MSRDKLGLAKVSSLERRRALFDGADEIWLPLLNNSTGTLDRRAPNVPAHARVDLDLAREAERKWMHGETVSIDGRGGPRSTVTGCSTFTSSRRRG
jgi:hypothetical protein